MIDEPERSLQVMHTISATAKDMQEEVQLAGRREPFQCRIHFQSEIASLSSSPG